MQQNPQTKTTDEIFRQAYEKSTQTYQIQPKRRRFNPWLSTEDQSWMSKIYSDCFPLGGTNKHRITSGLILGNLAISTEPISIFLDKKYYRSLRRKPMGFTPTNVSNICNSLLSKGYIRLHKGYCYQSGSAISSTIQPTEKLLALIPELITFRILPDGLIVIKEFDPPEVYPDHVMEAKEVLQMYNKTVNPKDMLYATYKGGFDVDGRFHGSSMICMPKEDRRTLQIDDKETFEIDVTNCLPSLLYTTERGSECPGDAYDIPGVPRDLTKVAMLMLLNCDSRKKALNALQREVNFGSHGRHLPADILMALERKHQILESFFYTGIGRKLMNIESRCMRRFLRETTEKSIKVYPIYDSAIGKLEDKEVIQESFIRSFTVNGIQPMVHC